MTRNAATFPRYGNLYSSLVAVENADPEAGLASLAGQLGWPYKRRGNTRGCSLLRDSV